MCEKDQYLLAVYALTLSLSMASAGMFILFSMGTIKMQDDFEAKQIINSGAGILPTSTLENYPAEQKLYSRKIRW
jgi:hypothetical protein